MAKKPRHTPLTVPLLPAEAIDLHVRDPTLKNVDRFVAVYRRAWQQLPRPGAPDGLAWIPTGVPGVNIFHPLGWKC
jgi:hypothetical protein